MVEETPILVDRCGGVYLSHDIPFLRPQALSLPVSSSESSTPFQSFSTDERTGIKYHFALKFTGGRNH